MEVMSEKQIVACIREGRCFDAAIDTGGFKICINRYVPVAATAIHDGHRVLERFARKMKVSDAERLFEEDPHTGVIAEAMDISISVINSRYCGDLNRSEERCLYKEAWGKQVWHEPLTTEDKQQLLQSHRTYYRVLDALLTELVNRFGAAVLYDLHSYNYSRLNGSPPLFNIGTHYIDMGRFEAVIEHLLKVLQAIELSDGENRAVLDEVFRGKGYQAEFTHQRHRNVLCVPLELKKIFMDESSFTVIEHIYDQLFSGTQQALQANGEFFMKLIAEERRGDDARN